MRFTTSSRWRYSVFSVFKNLRRAGVLKKRSRISTVVPCGCAAGETSASISRPSARTCHPLSCPSARDLRVRRDTELILANASPRKPKLATASRSSRAVIFEVAWRLSASGRSSLSIPLPSSRIRISFTPPCSTSTEIFVEPASMAFSMISLTTEAGLSTTSPAAIWLANCGESRCIRLIN